MPRPFTDVMAQVAFVVLMPVMPGVAALPLRPVAKENSAPATYGTT